MFNDNNKNTHNKARNYRFWQPDSLFLWTVIEHNFLRIINCLNQAPAEFSEKSGVKGS